jgi:hypothetical protein
MCQRENVKRSKPARANTTTHTFQNPLQKRCHHALFISASTHQPRKIPPFAIEKPPTAMIENPNPGNAPMIFRHLTLHDSGQNPSMPFSIACLARGC